MLCSGCAKKFNTRRLMTSTGASARRPRCSRLGRRGSWKLELIKNCPPMCFGGGESRFSGIMGKAQAALQVPMLSFQVDAIREHTDSS